MSAIPDKGWREAKPWLGKNGYWYVDMRADDGKRVKRLVHRLVWEDANGQIPKGMCINHINGVKTDNRLENLEVVTYRENNAHAAASGLSAKGERAGNAKITAEQAVAIATAEGRQVDVAKRFGVSRQIVKEIWRGKTWTHLGIPARTKEVFQRAAARKLSEWQVAEARRRVAAGESIGSVADSLQLNRSTLAKAVRGDSWAHLPGSVRS